MQKEMGLVKDHNKIDFETSAKINHAFLIHEAQIIGGKSIPTK